MTILSTDIKLLASERMTDTSDGGGRRTSNVIPDGVAGNIFPKISRLDATYGRVNLRKVFGSVVTFSLDTYAGAMAVVMDAPDNAKIHVNLFSTGSDFDDRTAARDRIESYVIAGPESRMVLYGRQLVNQMAIQTYQRVGETLPEVGDVYCLSKETAGVTAYQQFVRLGDIAHEIRTFTDANGDFQARVLTIKISAPLRYEFAGPDVPARTSSVAKPALVRYTSVADAARYYSIARLAESAAESALSLRVASVYSPIVPTTQRESPVSNVEMGGAASMRASALAPVDWFAALALSGGQTGAISVRLPAGILPGSLRMVIANTGAPTESAGALATDDGQGVIAAAPTNGWSRGFAAGTVDYAAGIISVGAINTNAFAAALWISYTPGVSVSQPAHSRSIPITLATRGTVYAETLLPAPAPGTVSLDFRALGKWYRLRDDSAGVLAGSDAAFGTGTVDYATGAVVVTLGALPDVGSAVLWSWGSPVHTTTRSQIVVEPPVWRHQLPDTGIEPGSVAIAWDLTTRSAGVVTGSVSKSVTDDGAGNLTGDGVGRIVYATGQLWFLPKLLPDPGSTPYVTYQKSTTVEESFTAGVDGAGMITLDLVAAPVVPGSVQIKWVTTRSKTTQEKTGSSASAVTYTVTPDPVSAPADKVDVAPVTPGYPLIGATLQNTLGLPVKFEPYSVASYGSGYYLNVPNGWFVVRIPQGQTKWGGATIATSDLLPLVTVAPPTMTVSYAGSGDISTLPMYSSAVSG